MKELIHLIPTWEKATKSWPNLLLVITTLACSHLAIAEPVTATIPHSSLFEVISARAKKLANDDYVAPKDIAVAALNNINYQDYRAIRFKQDNSLWKDEGLYELQLFHPGFLYKTPITINTVDHDAKLSRVPFSTDFYQYDGSAAPLKDEIAKSVANTQLGHAGFRLHYPLNTSRYKDEVVVFQGASYFRVVGPNQVYGLSARGLAIDTAENSGEEFPMFKEFWLVKPQPEHSNIIIFALLDSPSVTGAYKFDISPVTNTAVTVDMQIFARKDVKKLGVAPLTSMFYHGENSTKFFDDYRPEVHDSDGLLTQSQDNTWVWRPLNNPSQLSVTSFSYHNPKGFGLAQRDRDFNHYQDIEAHYHNRPSLWIEPQGDWGNGRVELVEIPTNTETNDNIVTYWVPEKPFKAGDSLALSYKISSFNAHLVQQHLATVVSTRIGSAALPGEDNPPPKSHRQFTVDFSGAEINQLSSQLNLQADLQLASGNARDVTVQKLPNSLGWRVAFKIAPHNGKPVDMRLALKLHDKEVSEVWSYVWYPNDIK
ncbi:glucan biosynthesis protein [Pseudoalteromonas sp.]|uniref:glucan biosynthesis protein n=1 Tax=Pseudoalteromonas sp. TaxID=53249 RepID=UPI0035675A97